MFGFLKNLLRKSSPPEEVAAVSAPARAGRSNTVTGTDSASTPPVRRSPVLSQTKGIPVPLQPILAGLPLELQPLVVQSSVGGLTISIPLEKILAQLSRGVVKLSFGELRQLAPDVFSAQEDRDRVLVSLPLNEILPRINPALIQRRRAQRHIQVPTEISSPFDQHGQSLVFAAEKVEPRAKAAEPAPPVTPMSSSPAVEEEGPIPFRPVNGKLNGAQQPPSNVPPHRNSIPSTSSPPPPAGPQIQAQLPAAPRKPMMQPEPRPASVPEPEPPVHASGNGNGNGNGHETVLVSLTSIAGDWPDTVRREIVDLKLVDAQVGVPMEALDHALKQGKIVFRWKSLRSWIKPSPVPGNSPHDNLALELPLRTVAPLFLERQKQKHKAQQKVSIDEDIPNLFFGFPQPEAEGGASGSTPGVPSAAKPAETNYYLWDDGSEMVRVDESSFKKAPSAETRFVQKYATPNEIVSRAAALEGVAGVLIALPDGLMVASQLPPEINGDTLAAFLPQIFGKVSTCTKELRMGELNNLNFTVGNVPWKIFRVNAIFFAAFGRAGQGLPTAQLAGLASELDHKPK